MGSRGLISIATALCLLGCPSGPPSAQDVPKDTVPAEPETEAGEDTGGAAEAPAESATELLGRLMSWMPAETLSVAFDRTTVRFDPRLLAAVFALPPKAADLLDERRLLDEALANAFASTEAEDAEPSDPTAKWLGRESLGFTLPMLRHAYFVRPILRPLAEVGPILVAAGFTSTEFEGKPAWTPKGAFPWRVVGLDERTIAFVPEDPSAGLQVLLDALTAPPPPIETQVTQALSADPQIEFTLLAAGPLLSLEVDASIAQLQFALRRPTSAKDYEGLILLMPEGDVDEAADQLRKRTSPEENHQVQALIAAVSWTPEPAQTPPQVVGRLALTPEQVELLAP